MEGYIMFPSGWLTLKLYEPGPYYTLIGFGSMTWHGLTINKNTWNRLPKDVQPILREVARDFEERTGTNNKERYSQDVAKLRNGLAKVKELSPQVRQDWAEALKDWPQEHANTLKKENLPVVKVLNTVLDSAEKRGYKWPVRYVIK
jgi:TRAP-type C4-dicarboxylate transport system substrate-binding protein